MANNKRVFYACQAVAIASPSEANATPPKSPFAAFYMTGVQSVGITTSFNLEQVFELGQLQIYENIEGTPDVEVTIEKVFDGGISILDAATQEAVQNAVGGAATLVGRSTERCRIALGLFSDTQDSVSFGPSKECIMDEMYVSNIAVNIPVDGNATESISFVGNSKEWKGANLVGVMNGLAGNADGTFTENNVTGAGTHSPPNKANLVGGVQRRENFDLGNSTLPTAIPGVDSNGLGYTSTDTNGKAIPLVHIQNISISTDLSREDVLELGRRNPYYRSPNFPIEVTCDIEIIATEDGDQINAFEDGNPALAGGPDQGNNTSEESIQILLEDGSNFDLGVKNRLSSVSYSGGDATGGNATITYSYTNFNDLTITGV